MKRRRDQKAGSESSTGRRLFAEVLRQKYTAAMLLLSGILTGLCQIGAPMLIARGIDAIPAEPSAAVSARVGIWALGLAALYLTGSLFQWLLSVLANVTASRVAADIRAAAFDRLSELPVGVLDRHPHGDYRSRLTTDVEMIADGLSQMLIQSSSGVTLMLGSLVMLFVLNRPVAAGVLLVTPLCFLVTRTINRNARAMFVRQAEAAGAVNALTGERIDGHRVVKGFGSESASCAQFELLNEQLRRATQKAQFYSSLTNPGTRFVNNIAYILVGVLACLSGGRSGLSVGVIAALLSYALQFAKPVNEYSAVTSQFQQALAGADRLFEVMDHEAEDRRSDRPDLSLRAGRIRWAHVNFAYERGKPLIRNLNLDIRPGAHVAIVGPTGAGKTTLVNLLMDFYALDSGAILIDDQPLETVSRSSVRRAFGMVLQDSWLFAGSVHENIAYGRPDAGRDAVVRAAKAARVHDMIRRLPQGYDTQLSDSSAALSMGEKQLLSIARVLLMNPEMLILDEATSNIDPLTERRIQKAFSDMTAGHTSFIIAHRLSTIREADLILVMEHGRVVQQGRHDALVQEPGLYQTLYNSQFEAMGAAAERGARHGTDCSIGQSG